MSETQIAPGIREVPEYRQMAILRAIQRASQSPSKHLVYWQNAWALEHHYWVRESTGVVYDLDTRYTRQAFLTPIDQRDVEWDGLTLQEGHRVDDAAILLCQCGNDRLQVWYPAAYETRARCPECGRSDTIASG